MMLTGYLKPKESEEKRENSNDPPTLRWYRYNRCDNTSINRWEMSSPSQPECVADRLSRLSV